MFSTGVDGQLSARGNELLLKVSAVDDYHNGSTDGFVAAGRQRWGDYSAVSLDPTDERSFWVSGEYAREYNDAAGGHPGGTGGSRWSEWVSQLSIGTTVPEPGTWAMMLVGFGFIGAVSRRRSAGYTTA
ncbi:PEPxxWA-CTERM sorting domain-containing protein [Sphingosinicellaceae bacterium]|nr:PEPxxWA-CTERM sorting domain-containing protein [Sphingosinicellaceae bacterium]